jgi:hypothetical protein
MGEWAKAVGAATFRDEYHVVWLIPGLIRWPKRCACCRGIADDLGGPKIDKLVGQQPLEYPICRRCRGHARFAEYLLFSALAAGFLLPALAFVILVGLPRPRSWAVFGMLWLGVGFVSSIVLYTLLDKVTPGAGRNCADRGWPIEFGAAPQEAPFGGEKAERSDEREIRHLGMALSAKVGSPLVALHVRNPAHAVELLELNGGSKQNIPTVKKKY